MDYMLFDSVIKNYGQVHKMDYMLFANVIKAIFTKISLYVIDNIRFDLAHICIV